MLTSDWRRQFIEAIERIVGDFQVEEREIQTIGIDNTIIGQVP